MNTIITTTTFIATAVLSAVFINPCSHEGKILEEQVSQISHDWECDSQISHDWECDSQISHDWECKYIVEDFYTKEVSMVHYVDEVIENVDGSITFVGEDGLVTRIPYPYYRVEKNTNKTLDK